MFLIMVRTKFSFVVLLQRCILVSANRELFWGGAYQISRNAKIIRGFSEVLRFISFWWFMEIEPVRFVLDKILGSRFN